MGFEPGTAGWGHRRIHWAMVAPRRRTFNGHKKGHREVSKEVTHSLCDQIGQFLEFLGNRFNYKSKPNVLWLFEQLWKPLNQTGDATIGQLLEKIGLLFIPTSGHTVCSSTVQCSVPLKSLSIIHLMLVSFVLNFCVQNVNRLLNGQVNNIITSTKWR